MGLPSLTNAFTSSPSLIQTFSPLPLLREFLLRLSLLTFIILLPLSKIFYHALHLQNYKLPHLLQQIPSLPPLSSQFYFPSFLPLQRLFSLNFPYKEKIPFAHRVLNSFTPFPYKIYSFNHVHRGLLSVVFAQVLPFLSSQILSFPHHLKSHLKVLIELLFSFLHFSKDLQSPTSSFEQSSLLFFPLFSSLRLSLPQIPSFTSLFMFLQSFTYCLLSILLLAFQKVSSPDFLSLSSI